VRRVTDYAAHWATLVSPLSESIACATRSMAFLHLPKTGGTSTKHGITSAPDWNFFALPPAVTPEYGVPSLLRPRIRRQTAARKSPTSLGIGLPHETYDAIRWLDSVLQERGSSFDLTVMLVRPVRLRIASAFADYWTQVARARAHADGTNELDEHWASITQRYLADSRHYRRDTGPINGRSWFRSFAVHGPGIPFFLSDVFAEGPRSMLEEVESGRLRIIPTSSIDQFVQELTGRAPTQRRRVSSAASDPAVLAALAESAAEIDLLAARDAAFDNVLADLLDDDSFLPRAVIR
jgi:hypothetical protein